MMMPASQTTGLTLEQQQQHPQTILVHPNAVGDSNSPLTPVQILAPTPLLAPQTYYDSGQVELIQLCYKLELQLLL